MLPKTPAFIQLIPGNHLSLCLSTVFIVKVTFLLKIWIKIIINSFTFYSYVLKECNLAVTNKTCEDYVLNVYVDCG